MLRSLLILLFSYILIIQVQAQETNLSLDFENRPLTEVLREIKRQAGIKLAYDARALRDLKLSVFLQSNDVESALNTCLKDTGYEAVLIKNTWLIIPREVMSPGSEEVIKRNFRVSGRLLDSSTDEPLPYANISLKGNHGGAMTNLDGYFNIPLVAVDTVPLCFSYVGYRTLCVDLAEHETENMVVRLDRRNTFLLAVDVYGKQNEFIASTPTQDMIKMDATGMSRISSQGQPDLFKSIQMLPGVSSGDVLDSQLHIRGGAEDENLVLWDGFTLYHLDHFFGVFSTLNPAVIQDINLYKGPYSSRYGARSGGVLDVIGKSGDRRNAHSRIDMNLINSSFLTEGPLGKKSSYLLSFRRSHTDLVNTGFYDDVLDRVFLESTRYDPGAEASQEVSSQYFYHDLNLKWNTEFSEKDRLSMTVFNGGDDFQRSSHFTVDEIGTPFSTRNIFGDDSFWGNTGLGLVWTRNPSPQSHSYTSFGFSEYKSSYYFSDEETRFFNDLAQTTSTDSELETNHIQDITLHHRRTRTMEDGGTLEYGYQFTHLQVERTITDHIFSLNITNFIDSNSFSNQHSLFLDRTWWPSSDLQFRAGGRMSSNSFTNKLYIEPRVKADLKLGSRLDMHISSGNYIQQIRRVAEQNLFLRQADRWEMSDGERIPESRTFHSALGLDYSNDKIKASVEFFHKEISGVILNREQNRSLSSIQSEDQGISTGKGTARGLDLLLNMDFGAQDLWVSYSYTESLNKLEDINSGKAYPSPFNKPHDLNVIYNLKHRDYVLHSQIIASSGYPYTRLAGYFYGPSGELFLAYDDDLLGRLPSIFRWDVTISRTLVIGHQDLSIGLGVFNLTDHKNIRSRSYTVDPATEGLPDDLRIRTIDLELIGLSPTFSLTLDLR